MVVSILVIRNIASRVLVLYFATTYLTTLLTCVSIMSPPLFILSFQYPEYY